MRVLIIEDDRALNASLCEVIETYGADCVGCLDGTAGRTRALNEEWDLILLDIMLPGMDGFEITRRLRTHGISTPILMLTARADTEDRITGLDNGADYYLSKGRDIDIIHLNGSIELAPILGLSDVIVDIVETGTTLRENDLTVVEDVVPISARLIANKASYKFKNTVIDNIVRCTAQLLEEKL